MKRNFHYAWVICAACTLLVFCNLGIASDSISYYLPYIKEAHGYSGAASSAIMTVKSVTAFLCMPLVVSFYDRVPMRLGGALACCAGGVAFCLFSFANSLPMYYLAAAFSGMAYSLGGMTAAALLAERWFARRKGFAMGIAAGGNGLAAFIFPPLVIFLVEGFGIRTSFLVQGGLCLAAAALFFLIARDRPSDMGIAPYGAGGSDAAAAKTHPDFSLPAGRMRLCCLATVLLGGAAVGSSSHYSILFVSNGVDAAAVSVAVAATSALMLVGKFSYGAICDKIGGRRGSMLFLLTLATGHLICSTMKNGNIPLMYVGLMVASVAFAPGTVGVPLWAGDFSTGKDFAKNLKWMQTGYTLGGLLCSALPGILFDLTGSYNPAYVLFAGFVLTALVIVRSNYLYMQNNAKSEVTVS